MFRLFVFLILPSWAIAQSPHKKFTYIADSIKYKTDSLSNSWQAIPTSPLLDFITIDYGLKTITIKNSSKYTTTSYSIVQTTEREDRKGETYAFFCTIGFTPYNIKLGLFYESWNRPVLLVNGSEGLYLYYLKKF